MFITVLLITVFALLFHWQFIYIYGYWRRKGFPSLPGCFPFGTSRDLALLTRYQGSVLQDFYNRLAPNQLGGFYMWNYPFLLLRSPEMLRTVMSKEFQHFRDRGRIESSSNSPLSKHLFSLDGDIWRAVRIKLTPAFTSGRLKHMYSLFEICASKFGETLKLNENQIVDIKQLVSQYAHHTISSCAFGLELTPAIKEQFVKATQLTLPKSVPVNKKIKMALVLMFPFIEKLNAFNFLNKDVDDFFLSLVANTVKYREENNITRNDFLDLLIQLKNKGTLESGEKELVVADSEQTNLEMTPDLLAAQCFVFFVAGFETSTSLITFALYELALNQDIQQRLYNEIVGVTKRYEGTITYQSFQEMPYLEQVISETMRKYPTLPLVTRRCTKSFSIPDTNLTIEEGTKIMIPIYAFHHDPKYFPEPDKFDPERFSSENKSSILPYTYLPFGEGPRLCIGKRFGLLQIRMCLYTLLRNYEVLPSTEPPQKLAFVASTLATTLKEPIKLLIKSREIIS